MTFLRSLSIAKSMVLHLKPSIHHSEATDAVLVPNARTSGGRTRRRKDPRRGPDSSHSSRPSLVRSRRRRPTSCSPPGVNQPRSVKHCSPCQTVFPFGTRRFRRLSSERCTMKVAEVKPRAQEGGPDPDPSTKEPGLPFPQVLGDLPSHLGSCETGGGTQSLRCFIPYFGVF